MFVSKCGEYHPGSSVFVIDITSQIDFEMYSHIHVHIMNDYFNLEYLKFPMSLYIITLRFDFVMYSLIQLINDFVLLFNHSTAENHINVSNKESFFEYHEVIKYGWP